MSDDVVITHENDGVATIEANQLYRKNTRGEESTTTTTTKATKRIKTEDYDVYNANQVYQTIFKEELTIAETKKTKTKEFIRQVLIVFFYVVMWYILSDLLILYNDWILVKYEFDFPMFMTMSHMSFSFFSARILCTSPVFKGLSDKLDGILDVNDKNGEAILQTIVSKREDEMDDDIGKEILDSNGNKWIAFCADVFVNIKKGAPIFLLAFFFVGDITFSNMAFEIVKVSTVEVINSISVMLVFVISMCMGTEHFDWRIFFTLVFIVGGSLLSSLDELEVEFTGVLYACLSMIFGSFKTIMIAKFLKPRGFHEPIALISYFTIPAILLSSIVAMFFEKDKMISENMDYGFFSTLTILIFNSFMAFLLNWFAFILIRNTSALTYEVLGSFKDLFVFLAAVFFLDETMNAFNVVGNIMVLFGVISYTVCRLIIMERRIEVHRMYGKNQVTSPLNHLFED